MAVEIDRAWPVHTTKPSGVQNSLALAGLVTTSRDGTIRTGIFPPVQDPNIVQSRSDMKVNVLPFRAVASRPGQGAVLIANASTRVVPLAAAPSANSRIDVVYAQAQDGAPPNSDPLYADPVNTGTDPYTGKPFQYSKTIIEVATGVAAGVPTRPSLPAGAVELAQITVASGSTATNASGSAITQTWQYTVASGGVLPYTNEAALQADLSVMVGQQAVSLYSGNEWTMSSKGWVNPSADSGWVACIPAGSDWTTQASFGYRGLSVRKIGSQVIIQGHCANTKATIGGSPATPWVGANIPAGFRPTFNSPVTNASSQGEVYVTPGGQLTFKYSYPSGIALISGAYTVD